MQFSGWSRQEYTPHTTASLLEPELPRTRGGIEPATARLRKQVRYHEATSKGHFASNKIARRHSKSASTHDLRRGFAANSHGATARARRHARSPQRVHPCTAKTHKNLGTLTTPIPEEGRAGRSEIAKTSSFCTSTTPIPAEGRNPDRRSKSCPGALES